MASLCYAHIGYPKCASTALQGGFFSQHPDLFHLGVNGGGAVAPFASAALREVMEVDLRTLTRLMYNPNRPKRVIGHHWNEFMESDKLRFGLSFEALTIIMASELEPVAKAERLRDIMGGDCRIIMVVREQLSLLKSLHKEFLRTGLGRTFNSFVKAVWTNQWQSLLSVIDFNVIHQLYSQLFGAENILVLAYEDLALRPDIALPQIQDHLEISHAITALPQNNVSFPPNVAEHFRRLNAAEPSGLGGDSFAPVNLHRAPQHVDSLGPAAQGAIAETNQHLRGKLARAQMNAKSAPEAYLDTSLEPDLEARLRRFYGPRNAAFAQRTGLDLARHGYAGCGSAAGAG